MAISYLLYDAAEPQLIEDYLEAKAAKGLQLTDHFGRFLLFEKGQPHCVRYRLEPFARGSEREAPDEDRAELYAQMGWDYVLTVIGYHIYRTEDPDAPELNTDPELQADTYRHTLRRELIFVLFLLAEATIFCILLCRDIFHDGTPLLRLLGTGSIRTLFAILSVFFEVGVILSMFVRFLILVRRIRIGTVKHINPRAIAIRRLLILAALVVIIVVAAFPYRRKTMQIAAAADAPYPLAVTLMDIEGEGFEYESEPFRYRDLDYDIRNYVEYTSDLLAPQIQRLKQYGTNGSYLYLEQYQLRNPSLASELFQELETRLERSENYNSMILSLDAGTDTQTGYGLSSLTAYDLFESRDQTGDYFTTAPEAYQHLFYQRGSWVFHICYRGSYDLRDLIPSLTEWIQQS